MDNRRILFVDDDPRVLKAIERQFDDEYDLTISTGPEEGLRSFRERGPFAAVISDMQMPNMSGIEMLMKMKEIDPDCIRMILTGFADLQTTVDAINRGNIYRFLSKPCSNDILQLAIEDGLRQHQLIRAEKELVEGTLTGSIRVLSEVLSLVNPAAFGRASRVKRIAVALSSRLQVEDAWEIEIAAMLSAIGCVTLSEELLCKIIDSDQLDEDELESFQRHPEVGRSLLANVPRLENVGRIVAYQEKHFDGSGVPCDSVHGTQIPLGARILKVALDFDTAECRSHNTAQALGSLQQSAARYDPVVLSELKPVVEHLFTSRAQDKQLSELRPGMVFAENVLSEQGQLLIARGQEVTDSVCKVLSTFASKELLVLPLRVVSCPEQGAAATV